MTQTTNESITVDQLIADSVPPADEVIRAAARTAPTADAIVMDVIHRHGRWLDVMTVDELRDAWRYYSGLTEWQPTSGPIDDLDVQIPVVTFASDPDGPPVRGHEVTPAWFTVHPGGWMCSYPHHDDVVTEEVGHPAHLVNSYALDHLDTHHPGWKLPCTACGKPQWNTEESHYCFDCRETR
jgi:hypothetical protein